jgi:hypothetical protein
MTPLAISRPEEAARLLDNLAHLDLNVRAGLEVRLLRASIALVRRSPDSEPLVKDALRQAERHGFVHSVIDSGPQPAEHVVLNSGRFP